MLALLLALPLVPASYWHRLSSITDESQDQTGSREAREMLLRESFTAFLRSPAHRCRSRPVQELRSRAGREQPWRESHNILLQVGAELGILGLSTLLFLIFRAAMCRSSRPSGCCGEPAALGRAGRPRISPPPWSRLTKPNGSRALGGDDGRPGRAGSSARCSRRWPTTGLSTICSRWRPPRARSSSIGLPPASPRAGREQAGRLQEVRA